MSEHQFSNLTLSARHFPDYSIEEDEAGNKRRVELPGKVQIGVVVEDVFVPLAERKAAGLFADIERVKKQKAAEPPVEPPAQSPPGQ